MRIRKIDLLQFVFYLSLTISFCTTQTIQIVVSFLWVLYAVSRKPKKEGLNRKDVRGFMKIYFVPCVLIHLYTIFLILLGLTEPDILTTNLMTYSSILMAISSVYVFGTQAVILEFASLATAWIFKSFATIFQFGFSTVSFAIAQGWFGAHGQMNYFELHDLVLACGYFILVYLYSDAKNRRNSFITTFLLFIMFIVGVKRIGILAVAVVLILYFVTNRLNDKEKFRIYKALGICGVFLCVLYVYLMYEGDWLYSFFEKYGIDLKARDYFYKSVVSSSRFSLDFWGYGRGFIKQFMNNHFSGFLDVHCDLLKVYIEIGLVFYIVWLIHYLVFIPHYMERNYGKPCAAFAMLVTIYTFVLYLSDNTEFYYICTLIRTTLPIAFCCNYKTFGTTFYNFSKAGKRYAVKDKG